MKVDTNTRGHRQWFYFSIKSKKKRTIKLNIFRFKKTYSLYQRGMKPYVKSIKSSENWKAAGFNIQYKKQKQSLSMGMKKQNDFYYLSFCYTFQFEQDEVFFAAGIPYTYTHLQKKLFYWRQNVGNQLNFQVQTLGKSMAGLNINAIKIHSNKQFLMKPKRIIVINARTHSGQASSSWVLDGFLNLISQQKQIINWINTENIAFYIMPMLNPDGVFVGNYRTGIVGDDFNRKFNSGKKHIFPEINYLQKLVILAKKQGNLQLFLDLHGHSILKNSFIYGPLQSQYCEFACKKLPTYLWHKSKYFRIGSCKFRDDKLMIETARIYFQQKENILSYTIQNSLGLYSVNQQTHQMKMQDWQKFGQSILLSLKSIFQMQKPTNFPLLQSKIQFISQKVQIGQTSQKSKSIDIKSLNSNNKKNQLSQKIKQPISVFQSTLKNKNNNVITKQRSNFQLSDNMINNQRKQRLNTQVKYRFPSLTSKQINNKQETFFFSKTLSKEKYTRNKIQQNDKKNNKDSSNSIFKLNSSEEKKNIIESSYAKGSKTKKITQLNELGKNLIVAQDLKTKIINKTKNLNQNKNKNSEVATNNQQFDNPFIKHPINKKPQRSITYDEKYLASQIQKMNKIQNEDSKKLQKLRINSWDESSNQSQSSQDMKILNNLSEIYEQSMNDSDDSQQDLCQNQKKYLLDCIKVNQNMFKFKRVKSQSSQQQNQQKQEIVPSQNLKNQSKDQHNKRINAFKQIVFTSNHYEKNDQIIEFTRLQIGNFKIRRNPHKFKQTIGPQLFKRNSMSKNIMSNEQLEQNRLYITQKKQLNQRFQKKQRRKQPFILLSIKQKINHKN